MPNASGYVDFGRRVAADFSDKNVTFMAAALAYHAFISLAPMLLLLFIVFTTFGAGLETRVASLASSWLPGPIGNVVTELLQGGPNGRGASVIGIVVLLWGTLKIFRGLDTAFSEIYETVDSNSLLDKFRDGVVVLVALALALVAMVGSGVLLEGFVAQLPFARVLTPIALLLGLIVAFYPIYYVFPDADVGVVDVVPGVVVAAVGWGIMQGLFQLYLSVANPSSGGFFGGVVVVVTYLYFSGLVLLLGAVVNAASGDHSTRHPGAITASAGSETAHHESYSVPELAAYLDDLRAGLLHGDGTYTRTDTFDERPVPSGDVEVVELSTDEDDTQEWTVTLRWSSAKEDVPDHRTDQADSGTFTDPDTADD